MTVLSAIDIHNPLATIPLAIQLDALGYHRLWLTEHRSASQSASPMLLATAVAAVTERIRVGTAGIMLRYAAPLKVAEDAWLLARLFPDRVDVGVIGARESDPALDAALLDGRGEGREYPRRVEELARWLARQAAIDPMLPARLHPAAPRLWVCSTSLSSAQLAAECGAGFAYGVSMARSRYGRDDPAVVDAYRSAVGTTSREATVVCYGACATTEAEAHRHFYGGGARSETRLAPDFLGTPARCLEQLEEIARRFDVVEVVVQCLGPDLPTRYQGYELLAEAFALTALVRASTTPPASESAKPSRRGTSRQDRAST